MMKKHHITQDIAMKLLLSFIYIVFGLLSIACSEPSSSYDQNNGTSGVGGTVMLVGGTGTTIDENTSTNSDIDASDQVSTGGTGTFSREEVSVLDATLGLPDGSFVNTGGSDNTDATIERSIGDSSDSDARVIDSAMTDTEVGDSSETDSGCFYSGNIRYTINREASPNADQQDAYQRLEVAMDEAVWYYNCYTNLDKQLWVNYNPGVPTAEANIDGWMSFGSDRNYMVVPTAMHEIAHTLGIGYYSFASMTDINGIWTGENANAVLTSISNPRDTQLHADAMHFWPYGLNYASEYENEEDLINHCRLVAAIRKDMGI